MEYDAFTGGVLPGGLRNTRDIGVLLCYMLDSTSVPFSQGDLLEIIQSNGMANYFETTAAISELIKNGNVVYADESRKLLELTDNGRMISKQLNSQLSLSLRQKAASAVAGINHRHRIESENPVTITKAKDGGYDVNLRMTDGIRDLMSLTLFVPDRKEAELVRKTFHKNPERVYSVMLASLIGDKKLIQEAIKELENE